MKDVPAEILFLRVPPRGLIRAAGDSGRLGRIRLAAAFAPAGYHGRLGERSITCFWIGIGRRVRMPGRQLLERLRGGRITEIIDIGCAGALDPSLTRGDLVVSSGDLGFAGAAPVAVRAFRRRRDLQSLLLEVAAGRGVRLRVAPILTHERFIAGRNERLELFEGTGCAAVQMEHYWFLRLLQSLMGADRLDAIRITHLVLITDAVPRDTGRTATCRSAWHALTGYAFPFGSSGILSLRRDILSRWPNG